METEERGARLDPLSYTTQWSIAQTYQSVRRHADAERAANRAIVLVPEDLAGHRFKAWNYVHWDGNTDRAWRVIDEAANSVAPARLAEMRYWFAFLDRDYDKALGALSSFTNTSFPGCFLPRCKERRLLIRAFVHHAADERSLVLIYADSARMALEQVIAEQLRAAEGVAGRPQGFEFPRLFLGQAYALLGRAADAVREGRQAVDQVPMSRDAYVSPFLVHELARIYVLVGDHESALEQLERFAADPSAG